MNLDLTESEQALFKVLEKGSRNNGTVSLDDLETALGGPSRHALTVRIKYLAAKVAPAGYIINQTGGVGRGNKASYRMEKKF